MSDAHITPSADDDLAARRALWRRRQRVLFWIAGVLLVANIVRIAWPVMTAAGQRWQAWRETQRVERIENARRERLAAQTSSLPPVDRVEVYLLSDSQPNGQGFPIRPDETEATIIKRVALVGNDAQDVAQLWRNCEFGGYGALCHDPLYGLRFYARNKLICETSLCWMCWNCQLKVDEHDYGWVGFGDPGKKLAAKLEAIASPPIAVQAAFAEMRATDLFFDEQYPLALEHLHRSISLDSSRLQARYLMAEIHEKQREINKAIDTYTEILKYDAMPIRAYRSRGLLRTGKGQFELAIDDYTSALKCESPDDVSRLFALIRSDRAVAYLQTTNPQSAVEDLSVAIRTPTYDEDGPKWLRLRAKAYQQLGDLSAANADLALAEQLETESPRPRVVTPQ